MTQQENLKSTASQTGFNKRALQTMNLPRNLIIDHGYLQVRIMFRGRVHCKNFGPDNADMRLVAAKYAADTKLAMRMGTFGVVKDLPSKKFSEVADLYFSIWSKELNAEGQPTHSASGIYTCELILSKTLKPFFGKFFIEDIKPIDVIRYRQQRIKDGVSPQTANREQGVLSSCFGFVRQWMEQERIEKFKLPKENPCKYVDLAPMKKREKLLTTQELSALKNAFVDLADPDGWAICAMAAKSLLRKKDVMKLEKGQEIDLIQSKTNVRVQIPIQVLQPMRYENFRKRFEAARRKAGLEFPLNDPRNVQFKDLRRWGATFLKGQNFSNTLISNMLGHKSTDTTEIYMARNSEHLKPLAEALNKIVDSL